MPGALGRRTPQTWEHVERFPLDALPLGARPTAVPVVLGINWYTAFDEPVKVRGTYWVGRDGQLGEIRGGHCVCLEAHAVHDTPGWRDFYDQGQEGACVGFGLSRAMSLLNRRRYDARWLWDRAKERDEWSDTNPGDDNGTSVHAGADVLRLVGHVAWRSAYAFDDVSVGARARRTPDPAQGIQAVRWARSADEVLRALGTPDRDSVTILNSWGRDYPQRVRMPANVLDRLMAEDGEAAVPTDR